MACENSVSRLAIRPLTVDGFILESSIEPAVGGALETRSSALHVVLRIEVGACLIGRSYSVHYGQIALIIERLERSECRV
jgi:hypothetical protein